MVHCNNFLITDKTQRKKLYFTILLFCSNLKQNSNKGGRGDNKNNYRNTRDRHNIKG